MDLKPQSSQVTARLHGDLYERTTEAAARLYHGNEAMLVREALIVYLDLRDALGFDFDKIIQPLRDRHLALAS